jgi:hypothetical protein
MSNERIEDLAEVYKALERIEHTVRQIPTSTSLEEIAEQLEPILAAQVERCQKIEQAQVRIEQEFNGQQRAIKQAASEVTNQFRGYQERMRNDMAEIRRAATQCEGAAAQYDNQAQDLSQRLIKTMSNVEGYLRHVAESSAGLIERQEREFTKACERLGAAINRLKSASGHILLWIAGAALLGTIVGALLASLLILGRLQQLGIINQGDSYRP